MTANVPEQISVIMPCYNSEKYISESIESVLAQTYSNFELIIVDDDSTDRSVKLLKKYESEHPDKITVLHQEHRGPYPARNFGLEYANGKYAAFLDSDDWWDKEFLKKLHEAIVKSDADIAYCGWQNIGLKDLESKPYIPPKYENQDIVSAFLKTCPWPIHAALVHKRLLDRMGGAGFSERYPTSMDYALWLNATAMTKKLVLVPEVLAFYRWHGPSQISSARWQQAIDAWNVRRDFVLENPVLFAHLDSKALNKIISRTLLEDAYKAYWARDLVSACHLFRKSLVTGGWAIKDLRYILLSLIPMNSYRSFIRFIDSIRSHLR